jgi:hypothetical protein
MQTIAGILAGLAAIAVFLWGLRRSRAGRMPARLRPEDGPDVLRFELSRVSAESPDDEAWVARYTTATSVTQFEIHLQKAEPTEGSPFAPGAVVFRRAPGTGADAFLADLSRALGLSRVPLSGDPVDELACDASFMGSRLTRGDGPDVIAGAFTTTPEGDWIVAKIFFAHGEGEVFLALNPVTGRGEFLSKDPAVSTPVVQELGRLFVPV